MTDEHARQAGEDDTHPPARQSTPLLDPGLGLALLANSGDCIAVLSPSGTLEDMNDAGLSLLEIDDLDALRRRDWYLLWPDTAHRFVIDAVAMASNGGVGQFSAPRHTAKGGHKWWDVRVSPIFDGDGKVQRLLSIARDVSDRQQGDELRTLLLGEMHHHVRNMLAIVQSMASQTARLSADRSRFITDFNGRLQALARAHDVLAESNSSAAPLPRLLAALLVDELPRYALAGPHVTLPAQMALHLALMLHELAANALIHGALSAQCGTVAVTWTIVETPRPRLLLQWRETGGPPVTHPLRRGFGRTVIERVGNQPHLQARPTYAPEGFACDIEADIPGAEAIQHRYFDPAKSGAAGHGQAAPPTRLVKPVASVAAAGRRRYRVLVVEDEPLIAMEIEDILRQAGYQTCGPVASVSEALAMLQAGACDMATVDGSLRHGELADPVVDALQARAIPFAFVTGLTPEAVPPAPHLADVPLVGKPIDPVALIAALDRLAASRRAGN